MKVSFLLTAWKEEATIGKVIAHLCDPEHSGYTGDFELLLVAPDNPTRDAALEMVKQMGIENKYRYFKDESKGKPRALNILFEEAKGEILVLTDGEVFFEQNAVRNLIDKLNSDEKYGGVSGRPVASNPKSTMYGYWAHMQADAVHRMRSDRDNRKHDKFFPMSGYIMAVRNLGFKFPKDLFLDDAYLTYIIFNKGYEIGYAPKARVMVKYPTAWSDFSKQKLRSLYGFEQLWKYSIIKPETKSRSFWHELSYFWYPIRYARNPIQLLWSIIYYPIRAYFWIRNKLGREFVRNAKSIRDVYDRTETTK